MARGNGVNMIEYADREMLALDVANRLAGDLKKALVAQEFVSFAVCGGTTPAPIFDMLCAADLDWARVQIMLTDERWVPEGHAASNASLIKRHLMTDKAAAAQFVPFYRDGMTATAGAADVSPALDASLPLSVLMLGMGADMHTASLFPGAQGLTEAMAPNAPNLCAVQPEGQDIARITLSAPVLNGAMTKHLIIYGDEKRAALDRAQSLPPQDAPVAAVLAGADIHWAA